MIKSKYLRPGRPSSGFSLIEVMIAVVILATGLLALAALQGSLTRASAEAKTRGRVAAMLTARMEELRLQSAGLANGSTTTTSTADPCDGDATDWLDCTRVEANLDSLGVVQAVETWFGDSTFSSGSTTDPDVAQFKRIRLTASWTDSTNVDHSLTSRTDVSALSLVTSLIRPPDSNEAGGSNPIVRQDSPITAGMIPIVVGSDGQASAATNPKPELVGSGTNAQILGTRFNQLTYFPETTPRTAAIIQRNFENEIIKCKCQYGAGGTNLPEIYRTAQWPVVWTGVRYDLSSLASEAAAPGQTFSSGPRSGATQSPLCQECCRDHHDSGATGVAKFDPERTDGNAKYAFDNQNQLVPTADTTSANYIDSCRVIRVDGFWRVAADTYARHYGLLETTSVGGVRAKSGVVTSAATTAYTTFVKDYLDAYDGTQAVLATSADAAFDAIPALNQPAQIQILAPLSTDYRYLHGRGLYVDYLEEDARDFLADRLENCPTGTSAADCVLPYLPFTTINLTEIARWTASDSSILLVNSRNILATNPDEPSGGRTVGVSAGTAENVSTMNRSNSGLAFYKIGTTVDPLSDSAVDPQDATATASDAQDFIVGGIPADPNRSFSVRVSGGALNPFVYYSLPADDGECQKPQNSVDHVCATNTDLNVALAGGSIRLTGYNTLPENGTQTFTIGATQCRVVTQGQNAYPGGLQFTLNNVPVLGNYRVSSVAIGAGPGSVGTPSNPTADNTAREETIVGVSGIDRTTRVDVTLTLEGTRNDATIAECTVTRQGQSWTLTVQTWNRPWL